jgi:lysyl-tRNA synthetase class 2
MSPIPFDPQHLRLKTLHPALALRSRILQLIRGFFVDRDFLEVETPVRIAAPAPELHIDAQSSGTAYLRTSPELHMKRMLASGFERIFQMGPCFRRGERGPVHHPEYTMLEFYRAHADYRDALADTKALIAHVAKALHGSLNIVYQGRPIDLATWERLEVDEAFILHAGWSPVRSYDADRFDLDLVDCVEPAFPKGNPMVLMDYPIEAGALARRKPGRPEVAERWELYIGGLELANAFSELTDADEQEERFEICTRRRNDAGRETYPRDDEFLAALRRGLPPAAGAALGVDRLAMLFADAADLGDVVAFQESPD